MRSSGQTRLAVGAMRVDRAARDDRVQWLDARGRRVAQRRAERVRLALAIRLAHPARRWTRR